MEQKRNWKRAGWGANAEPAEQVAGVELETTMVEQAELDTTMVEQKTTTVKQME